MPDDQASDGSDTDQDIPQNKKMLSRELQQSLGLDMPSRSESFDFPRLSSLNSGKLTPSGRQSVPKGVSSRDASLFSFLCFIQNFDFSPLMDANNSAANKRNRSHKNMKRWVICFVSALFRIPMMYIRDL